MNRSCSVRVFPSAILLTKPHRSSSRLTVQSVKLSQQLRQLGDIYCDPSRLIAGEQTWLRIAGPVHLRNRHRRAADRCGRGRNGKLPLKTVVCLSAMIQLIQILKTITAATIRAPTTKLQLKKRGDGSGIVGLSLVLAMQMVIRGLLLSSLTKTSPQRIKAEASGGRATDQL